MKKFLAMGLALLMCVALLAGCGGGASSTGGSTAPADGSEAASTAEGDAGTGSGDNILKLGLSSIGGVFNPIMADEVYDMYVNELVFDLLVDNDDTGEYYSTVADLEISEDHRTYTFTVKDGVVFSDGTPMTSEDIEFTFLTMAHPDYDGPRDDAVMYLEGYDEYRGGADTFTGIEVIDEKTIAFTFKEDQVSPANIAHFNYGVLPKAYYQFENWEDFLAKNDEPMGSGKFVFDSWALNEHVTLSKNESYWDADNAAKIDGIIMMNVPEESLIGSLSTGAIDLGMPSAAQENLDEMEALDNITVNNFTGLGYTYMQFNTTLPKLEDVRVRQALLYALDRKAFIESYYGELASVGLAPFAPSSWAFPDVSDVDAYDYDQAKAAELMDEAGWEMSDDGYRYKDGEKFSVTWLVYEDSPWPGVLAGMAYDTWKELGVDLIIENTDFVTVSGRANDPPPGEKDFEIYTMGFSVDPEPNPEGGLFDADAYTAGGFNASGLRDEDSQALLVQAKAEFDQDKRAEIYKEWAIRQTEIIPTVIIAYRNEIWGINNRVSGLDKMGTFAKWTQVISGVELS